MFSPQKIPQEEDILYQWRLKRKLEAAHENAARDKGLYLFLKEFYFTFTGLLN